uniref:Uncharacterized protein n=1 Tax=Arundo donax TaxID=35708 RepID=A0A0A9DM83_ARUDO
METVLFAESLVTLLVNARIANGTKSLQIWLLARLLEEHRGRRDLLLANGKRITCSCSWCWYDQSEVYYGKNRAIEECAACSFHQEESRQRLSTM